MRVWLQTVWGDVQVLAHAVFSFRGGRDKRDKRGKGHSLEAFHPFSRLSRSSPYGAEPSAGLLFVNLVKPKAL